MTNWYDDSLFQGDADDGVRQLNKFATPVFRLTLQSHWQQGHPFEYQDQYAKLFSVFEPYLRRDAGRLVMVETAGTRPRRRTSITDDDWQPFQQMQDKVLSGANPADEISEWRFIGFDYQASPKAEKRSGAGATKFFLHVREAINLDVSIPVADFDAGGFDVAGLKAALLTIPAVTAIAGYGMGFTDSFGSLGGGDASLRLIAERYPALDLLRPVNRTWRGAHPDNFKEYWLVGINWLTLVGEPILSRLGGVAKITRGLDPRITWQEGDNTVLFQLGPHPITGQKSVDDDLLPLYFELGARLKPLGDDFPSASWRTQDVFGSVGDNELKLLNNDWSRRFYDRRWFERYPDA